jgi:flagellar biosynthesis/type III secretory pathway M-ring protein FliF/YscJ
MVRKNVEELVRRAIPNSEAYVWVDTTWDLSRRTIKKHVIDAATPKSINKLKISELHTDEPGAIVGTQPNIRRNTNMQPEGNSRKIMRKADRQESKIINEFSYTDTETVPDPTITKQTISVVIHLPYEYHYVDNDPSKGWVMASAKTAAAQGDGETEDARQKFPMAPLKDDALAALESSIRKAAGMLDGEDNREVIVQQIPWRPALEPDKQREIVDRWREFLAGNAVPLALMAVLLIAILFLYLQAKRTLPTEKLALPDLAALTGSAIPKSQSEQDKSQAEFENMRGQIGDMISEDPTKATSIIRRWMANRGGGE